MSAVASGPAVDFDALLTKALPDGGGESGRYASDLDRMINGAAAREQDQLNSRNLSGILSNIRDHGPAGDQSQDLHTDTSESAAESEVPGDATTHNQQDLLTSVRNDVVHTVASERNSRVIWQISTLVLLVALVGVTTLFQLRNDESLLQISTGLEQVSNEYIKQLSAIPAEAVQPLAASQDADAGGLRELETTVRQLNEEMQMLNLRLDEIGEMQMNETTELRTIIQSEIAPRLDKLAATEVAIAEATTNIVTTTQKLELSPATTITQPVDAAVNWMVNIGSFSDREKAETINQLLLSRELKAMMHEVSLADGIVYRISIGGFESKEQATEFKNNGAVELGFSNAWIRQG